VCPADSQSRICRRSHPTSLLWNSSKRGKGEDLSVSAILVVGTRSLLDVTGDGASSGEKPPGPLPTVKILGKSVLERTIGRLRAAGIKTVSAISEAGLGRAFVADALMKQARKGFTQVLLVRLGAYAEVDYTELLKFHYEAGATVTRVCNTDGPLDIWALDPAPVVQDGTGFDPSADIGVDMPVLYLTKGYVNRLEDACALRRLAVDSLLGRCAMRPCGKELEPGVWIDHGAHVHRAAGIVAPAYIGRGTRVRADAVISSLSAIEQCCLVDRGAIIEDASILPHTYIGKGIDVSHAVVDGHRLMHMRFDTAVTIEDGKMIGRPPSSWRSLRYRDKETEVIRPAARPVELEPLAFAPQRQHPALRIFSKGEV